MGDNVGCPQSAARADCCAITPGDWVDVQKRAQCRDVAKRVTFSKGGPIVLAKGGTTVDEPRINERETIYKMILHEAEKLRAARAGLSKEQAIQETCERFPHMYDAYSDRMRRGDALEDLTPPAPVAVVKANATKAEILETIQKRAAPIAAAQKITMDQAVVKVVCETPEGKALYNAYVNARP